MAGPTHGSTAIANNGQSVTSATVALTMPAGALTGDRAMVAINAATGTGAFTTIPAGWELLLPPVLSGTVDECWIFSRLCQGVQGATSTDAGVTFTWTFTVVQKCLGVLDLITGGDTTNPFNIQGSANSNTTNTVLTAPTITTKINNGFIYEVFSGRTATVANAAGTPSASITASAFASTNYAAAPQLSLQTAFRTTNQAAAGSVGGDTMTYTTTNTNQVTYTMNLVGYRGQMLNNYEFFRVPDGISMSEKIR